MPCSDFSCLLASFLFYPDLGRLVPCSLWYPFVFSSSFYLFGRVRKGDSPHRVDFFAWCITVGFLTVVYLLAGSHYVRAVLAAVFFGASCLGCEKNGD